MHTHPPCPKCQSPQHSAICEGCGHVLLEIIDRRFVLLALLGAGGFGKIYKAYDLVGQREIALKLLHPGLQEDPAAVERFEREIRLTQSLHSLSPHVVELVCAGEDPQVGRYYAMEYLRGQTLAARLAQGKALSRDSIFQILQQLCEVLAAAHKLGVIHRDLKPDNVFLVEKEGSSFAKLLDFGVAKDLETTQKNLTMGLLGSPRYMAPEQGLSAHITPQTDIYGLGLLAYEMLTQTPAFRGDTLKEVLDGQLFQKPEPLHQRCPGRAYPMGLEFALFRALAKDPRERQASVEEFWQQLRPFRRQTFQNQVQVWSIPQGPAASASRPKQDRGTLAEEERGWRRWLCRLTRPAQRGLGRGQKA